MIARPGNGNFLSSHYDWIAAGVGLAALAGAVAFCMFGGDVEEEIDSVVGGISSGSSSGKLVPEIDMDAYAASTNASPHLRKFRAVTDKATVLFASEKRLVCANPGCALATPVRRDEAKNLVCAFCGYTQEVAQVVKVADGDGDGMPDDWERKFGLDLTKDDAGLDKDRDGFTNGEEYEAKTDPTDPKSHPDYLDSLKIRLPLKETHLPFVFLSANKIPAGWRCTFFDASQKDDYGRAGKSLTALVGEEIGLSGYVLKGYEKKEAKRNIAGGQGMKKTVDVSEATVVRKRDGKKITMVVAASKKAKPAAVDVQATLEYERGSVRTFDVVTGSEIDLNGTKYRIVSISAAGKGAKVVIEQVSSGAKRTLSALEP